MIPLAVARRDHIGPKINYLSDPPGGMMTNHGGIGGHLRSLE
jgi:hypothetical protein